MVDVAHSVTEPGVPRGDGAHRGGALGGVEQWIRQHKLPVAGGALVVVLGLVAHRRAGSSASSSAGTAQPAANVAPGTGTPNAYTAGGSYDSTASDLYNSIQPQIEALASQVAALTAATQPDPAGEGTKLSAAQAPAMRAAIAAKFGTPAAAAAAAGASSSTPPKNSAAVAKLNGSALRQAIGGKR